MVWEFGHDEVVITNCNFIKILDFLIVNMLFLFRFERWDELWYENFPIFN